MEKTGKLYLINAKLSEIKESVQMYRENENMYCYSNKVLEHLDAALEEMRGHPHWRRPVDLPGNMIWSDVCNPDNRPDPFAYGGDMPMEDFVRMRDEYFANKGNKVLDTADFRSEAKAEEEIKNDEEGRIVAGTNDCDTGCAVDRNVGYRTPIDGKNRTIERSYARSVNGRREVYDVVLDKW